MTEPEMTPDAAPDRLCANCGSGMQAGQDWCLECGTAAPGRLGGLRPGWRAVSTTLALTLVLVGGAGAASYAALSSDANREATASVPMDGAPVAQAPPVVPAPAAPVTPAPPAPAGPTGASGAIPTVETPAAKLPTAPKVTPPAVTTTNAQVTPAPTTTTPATTTPAPSKDTTKDADGVDRGEGTSADGDTTAADEALEPIALGADALAIYDPYKRATNPGDPANAYDSDSGSTFTVGAPDDGKELQVGVVVDLEAAKQVRGLELTTSTPGARLEVYATDGSALPPDVLDTRWDHPSSRKAIDRKERIVLPKGGAKYRYVLLWFTTPAEGSRRVGITELKVLG